MFFHDMAHSMTSLAHLFIYDVIFLFPFWLTWWYPFIYDVSGLKYSASYQFSSQCSVRGDLKWIISFLNRDALNHFSPVKGAFAKHVGHEYSTGKENIEILYGFGTTPLHEMTAIVPQWFNTGTRILTVHDSVLSTKVKRFEEAIQQQYVTISTQRPVVPLKYPVTWPSLK